MAQKFVGIDLGTHRIKGVVVTVGMRGVQVHSTFEAEVEAQGDNESQLAAGAATALRALRDRGLAHLPVGLAISGGMASYRVLKFPFADAKRINQALGFEIEGQFPHPLVDLTYDHIVAVGQGRRGGQALVVAVRKAVLEAVTSSYREAGVDLRLVTASPVALAQVLGTDITPLAPEQAEGDLTASALVVDIGARTTEIVALGDKGPVAVRSLRRGGRHVTHALSRTYGMDLEAAETAKLTDAFLPHAGVGELDDAQSRSAAVAARAIEVVVREIEQTRLWLRTELRQEVTELRLAGGGVHLRGLAEYLGEQVGLPVTLAEPNLRLSGAVPDTGWSVYGTALGAAVGAVKRPLIRLNDASAIERDAGWLTEQFGALALIGVAVLAFASIDTIVKIRALETELSRHEDELAAVTEEHFGQSLLSSAEIEAALAEVEGTDLTRVLPERGAFEVLQMVTAAASPTDAKKAAEAAAAPIDPTTGEPTAEPYFAPGEAKDEDEDEEEDGDEGEPADTTGAPLSPVELDKGIVMDDDLRVAALDIREKKLEIKVSATRAAAQDRLAIKLKELGCISNITKGKITDSRDDRKSFEMAMDHECYRELKPANEDEESAEEEE